MTSLAPRVRTVALGCILLIVLSACVNRAGSASSRPGATESSTSVLPSSPTATSQTSETEMPTYAPPPDPLVPVAIDRWELLPYEIPSGMDYVTVQATVTQRDPNSGQLAGDVLYPLYVERDADQIYYVCGWLDYQ